MPLITYFKVIEIRDSSPFFFFFLHLAIKIYEIIFFCDLPYFTSYCNSLFTRNAEFFTIFLRCWRSILIYCLRVIFSTIVVILQHFKRNFKRIKIIVLFLDYSYYYVITDFNETSLLWLATRIHRLELFTSFESDTKFCFVK